MPVAFRVGFAAEDIDEAPRLHGQSIGTGEANVRRSNVCEKSEVVDLKSQFLRSWAVGKLQVLRGSASALAATARQTSRVGGVAFHGAAKRPLDEAHAKRERSLAGC